MTSELIRDPLIDHLLTPANSPRELQRDWARADTVDELVDIVLTTRLLAAV